MCAGAQLPVYAVGRTAGPPATCWLHPVPVRTGPVGGASPDWARKACCMRMARPRARPAAKMRQKTMATVRRVSGDLNERGRGEREEAGTAIRTGARTDDKADPGARTEVRLVAVGGGRTQRAGGRTYFESY
jgi:hypothetical protein